MSMSFRYALLAVLYMGSSNAECGWLYFTAKSSNAAIYSGAIKSQPLLLLNKGLSLEIRCEQDECVLEENDGWVHINKQETLGAGTDAKQVSIPDGWIFLDDFYREDDFERVTDWKFKYLIVDWQLWTENYCFNSRGEGVFSITPNEIVIAEKVFVFMVDDIVNFSTRADRAVGRSDAIFDRKIMRLCPIAFQNDACDEFYATKGGYSWRFSLINKKNKIHLNEQWCR